jgi:serine/threonine protein kinase
VKIPRTVGRYEALDLIGRGGMGTLYRARDPRIGRFVAIQQLTPARAGPGVLARSTDPRTTAHRRA